MAVVTITTSEKIVEAVPFEVVDLDKEIISILPAPACYVSQNVQEN